MKTGKKAEMLILVGLCLFQKLNVLVSLYSYSNTLTTKVFWRNKKNLKILAVLLYFFGFSLGNSDFLFLFKKLCLCFLDYKD